jgi:hypothetical protein
MNKWCVNKNLLGRLGAVARHRAPGLSSTYRLVRQPLIRKIALAVVFFKTGDNTEAHTNHSVIFVQKCVIIEDLVQTTHCKHTLEPTINMNDREACSFSMDVQKITLS